MAQMPKYCSVQPSTTPTSMGADRKRHGKKRRHKYERENKEQSRNESRVKSRRFRRSPSYRGWNNPCNYFPPQSATPPSQTSVSAPAPGAASLAFRAPVPAASPVQTAVTPTVPAAASPAFRASAPAAQPVQTAVKATVRVAASPAFRASASSGDYHTTINQKIGEVQENICSLRVLIDEDLRQRNLECEQKMEKVQGQLKQYQRTCVMQKQKIEELEGNFKDYQKRDETNSQRIQELEEELSDYQERDETNNQRIQELEEELSDYQERDETNNQRIQELEEELSDYQERDETNNQRIQELEEELSGTCGLYEYPMNRFPRGMCIIINNIHFKYPNGTTDKREGAEFDQFELGKLFNELSFDVHVSRDLNSLQMRCLAIDVAGEIDHGQFDAFVFIVMSHGEERDVISGVDGRLVRVEALMSEFKAANCPKLQSKPKLFFIQTCRGNSIESPFRASGDVDSPPVFSPDSTLPRSACPQEADFLLAFATAPGYVSYRKPLSGSTFIQTLVKTIRELHNSHHLLDILTEVNKRVVESGINGGAAIQVPAPTHTLRGKVYLK